jgi:hypothetical protein
MPDDNWDWADQFAWDVEKHYGWIGERLRNEIAAAARKEFGCPECGDKRGECDHRRS